MTSLYEGLKNSKNEKKLLKFVLKKINEERNCNDVVKLLADSAQSAYTLNVEDLDAANDYGTSIELLARTHEGSDFDLPIFARIGKFLSELCFAAYHAEVFFNDILIHDCTKFLLAMHKSNRLQFLGAYLGCSFVVGFHKIYCELEKNINLLSVSNQLVSSLVEKVEQDRNHLKELRKLWVVYMNFLRAGFVYPKFNITLTEKLCSLFESCDILYQDNSIYFDFYVHCLTIPPFKIMSTALTSLKRILQSTSVPDSNKLILMKRMIQENSAKIFYQLATSNFVMIVEKIIWILIRIYKANLFIAVWTAEQFETILVNVFSDRKTLRKLSGEFLLLIYKDANDKNFYNILEFFLNYSSDPDQLENLLDAIWNFSYMKSFENIFNIFTKPKNEESSVCNATVAHFSVAIVKKFIDDDDYKEENILECLKFAPLALQLLENDPISYGILTKIFSMVELSLYDPHYIGHHKYVECLMKTLKKVLLNKTEYDVLRCSMSTFVKLVKEINYSKAKLELSEIADTIYFQFKETHRFWIVSSEMDAEHLKELELAICKVSIGLTNGHVFDEDKEIDLLNMTKCAVLVDERFVNSSEQYEAIEIFYIDSVSRLLILQLTDMVEKKDINTSQMENIMDCIKNLIKMLAKRLERCEKLNLFFAEKTIRILIHMALVVQPGFLFSRSVTVELTFSCTHLDLHVYNLVVNTCVSILFDGANDTAVSHSALVLKRMIFGHLIKLHRDHIALPPSNAPWRIFTKMSINHEFIDQIEELQLTISRINSPLEKNGFRISSILSVVLIHLSSDSETRNIKTIIRRLIDLFKTNLDIMQWKEIFEMITLITIKNFSKIVNAVPITSRNRILTLDLLKPFVVDNEKCVHEILKSLELLSGELLRKDEMNALSEFKNYILNLKS